MADRTGAVRLYARLVGAEVRSALEYPSAFAVGAVTNVLLTGLDLVAVTAVFSNVDRLAGFRLAEVVLLYGVAQTAFYLADLFVGHVDDLPQMVRTGRLDVLLLRPRGVLFQVLAGEVDLRAVGKVAQGLVVLGIGLAVADVAWSASTAVLLVVAILAGVAIYGGVWVATTSICFWLIDAREVSSAFTYGGRQMSLYPLGIYSPWLRHLVRLVVPLAFTAYYPTLGLLGRDDPLGGPSWLAWAGPFVALAVLAVASVVWRTGLRAYRSVGA